MAKTNSNWSFVYWLRKAGASLFFLGYFPFGSGTIGSAVAVTGLWFAHSRLGDLHSPERLPFYWGAVFLVVAISMFISSQSKEIFGQEDSPRIIIDEVAGQIITFFMIPLSINTLLIGFLLFRFFDIVKPFPVSSMQELDGGVGVTMDDVLAGVYANLSLMLILAGYQFIRSYL